MMGARSRHGELAIRNVSKEVDFAVQLAQPQPEMNTGIKMEVAKSGDTCSSFCHIGGD